MLARLLSTLKDLIKRATVTKGGADDGQFNIQQVTYLGKVADCEIIFPYGMSANLPKDALLVMFNVNANEQNRAGIGTLPNERKKNLEPGEVAFFHPLTKSFIYFRNSGDIDIDTSTAEKFIVSEGEFEGSQFSEDFNLFTAENQIGANINITCNDANLTCNNLNVTASQSVTIAATENAIITCDVASLTAGTSTTFDTPIATFTGNVQIDGNLTVTGSSTLSGTVTSSGTNIGTTHTHPITSGSSAPGPTGTPT